jgi:hypothetical protein
MFFMLAATLVISSCSKDTKQPLRYFEVGIKGTQDDWRDSAFVVATADVQLINKISDQLEKPVTSRQILMGELAPGNGGYNKNAGHSFTWHFIENKWSLVDVSAEIYDGRAHSDVDLNPKYWMDTLKRFSPWGSYIKKEIIK